MPGCELTCGNGEGESRELTNGDVGSRSKEVNTRKLPGPGTCNQTQRVQVQSITNPPEMMKEKSIKKLPGGCLMPDVKGVAKKRGVLNFTTLA